MTGRGDGTPGGARSARCWQCLSVGARPHPVSAHSESQKPLNSVSHICHLGDIYLCDHEILSIGSIIGMLLLHSLIAGVHVGDVHDHRMV